MYTKKIFICAFLFFVCYLILNYLSNETEAFGGGHGGRGGGRGIGYGGRGGIGYGGRRGYFLKCIYKVHRLEIFIVCDKIINTY